MADESPTSSRQRAFSDPLPLVSLFPVTSSPTSPAPEVAAAAAAAAAAEDASTTSCPDPSEFNRCRRVLRADGRWVPAFVVSLSVAIPTDDEKCLLPRPPPPRNIGADRVRRTSNDFRGSRTQPGMTSPPLPESKGDTNHCCAAAAAAARSTDSLCSLSGATASTHSTGTAGSVVILPIGNSQLISQPNEAKWTLVEVDDDEGEEGD